MLIILIVITFFVMLFLNKKKIGEVDNIYCVCVLVIMLPDYQQLQVQSNNKVYHHK